MPVLLHQGDKSCKFLQSLSFTICKVKVTRAYFSYEQRAMGVKCVLGVGKEKGSLGSEAFNGSAMEVIDMGAVEVGHNRDWKQENQSLLSSNLISNINHIDTTTMCCCSFVLWDPGDYREPGSLPSFLSQCTDLGKVLNSCTEPRTGQRPSSYIIHCSEF